MRASSPQKNVGQTGSLPSLLLRPNRRSQGKLPVCPTFAPRFSFFQRVVTRHEGSSKNNSLPLAISHLFFARIYVSSAEFLRAEFLRKDNTRMFLCPYTLRRE